MRRRLANRLLSASVLLALFAIGETAFRLIAVDRLLEYELDPDVYWRLRPNQIGYVWMGGETLTSPDARINNIGLRGFDVAPQLVWPQARLGRWNDDVIEGVRALANAGGVIALTGVDDALAKLPTKQVVIPGDGHPSAVAHRAVGRYLADAVRDFL